MTRIDIDLSKRTGPLRGAARLEPAQRDALSPRDGSARIPLSLASHAFSLLTLTPYE